jgi:hypothetical protein
MNFLSMQQQLKLISAGAAAHRQDASTVSATNELSIIPAGVTNKQPRKHEKNTRTDKKVALLEDASTVSATNELSIIPAGVTNRQPRKREKDPRADQKVALLALVQSLEGEHAEQKTTPPQSLQATKQTKSDPHSSQPQLQMNQLQRPLTFWENAHQWLEQQLTSQQPTWETCKRNVLGCSAVSIAIAICIISAAVAYLCFVLKFFSTISRNRREKKSQQAQPEHEPAQVKTKELVTSEELITSEVSKHLADLADLVGKVKMPSENSSHVALQAMQASRIPCSPYAEAIPDNDDGTHDI